MAATGQSGRRRETPDRSPWSWRAYLLLGLVSCLFPATGCLAPPISASLSSAELPARSPDHQPLRRELILAPFHDQRPLKDEGVWVIALIPLVPYGTSHHERPESWRVGPYKPLEEVPRALAEEIGRARIFSTVRLVKTGLEGEGNADLILEGAVRRCGLDRRVYTYGLSVLAAPLWVVGFPFRSLRLVFGAYVRVIDARTGETLWEYEFEVDEEDLQGMWGRSFDPDFPHLVARGIRSTVLDLDRCASEGRLGPGEADE